PELGELVEVAAQLGAAEIAQPVVPRARLDVAVLAGEVAQRAGVDPKRLQPAEADPRAPAAVRGPVRVDEAAVGGSVRRHGGDQAAVVHAGSGWAADAAV